MLYEVITFLSVNGVSLPYAVFDNADDVTTSGGEKLGKRLEAVLGRLWELKKTQV